MNKKEMILTIVMAFISFFAFKSYAMQQITVTTGYGYYSYNGQIVADYNYAPGTYSICNGLTQTEVANVSQLNDQLVNSTAYSTFMNTVGCN